MADTRPELAYSFRPSHRQEPTSSRTHLSSTQQLAAATTAVGSERARLDSVQHTRGGVMAEAGSGEQWTVHGGDHTGGLP